MIEYNLNKIILIAAPSGAGKTSIARNLLKNFPQLAFSVSATTRSPRGQEKNGVDYHFLSLSEFRANIQLDKFVEWEMVYEGRYYGTLKSELKRIWDNNQIPVLDLDVKGAINIQKQYPNNSISIFIKPPSLKELRRRLEMRGTETVETIKTRLNKASYEISFIRQFDHVVVNKDLDQASEEAIGLVKAFLKNEPPSFARNPAF